MMIVIIDLFNIASRFTRSIMIIIIAIITTTTTTIIIMVKIKTGCDIK